MQEKAIAQIVTPVTVLNQPNKQTALDRIKQQLVQAKTEPVKVENEVKQAENIEVDAEQPLTERSFTNAWNDFLAHLLTINKSSLNAILKNAKFTINQNNLVELSLASQHEAEMFEEHKLLAIPFLRKQLNNFKLDFNLKVLSSGAFKRAYTNVEKFDAMAEKNAALIDFKNLLELNL